MSAKRKTQPEGLSPEAFDGGKNSSPEPDINWLKVRGEPQPVYFQRI